MKTNTNKLLIIGLLASSLTLFSCSRAASQKEWNEMTPAEKQQALNDKIDNYFVGLTDWSKISPLKADEKSAVGKPRESVEKLSVDTGDGAQTVPATCTTQDFDFFRSFS